MRSWLISILMIGMIGHVLAEQPDAARRDSLLAELNHTNPDTTRIRLLVRLALARTGQDHEASLAYAREALGLAGKLKDSRGSASALQALGLVHRRLGAMDSAIHYLERATSASTKGGFVETRLKALNQLGVSLRQRGNLDSAEACHRAAIRLAEGAGMEIEIVENGIELGQIAFARNDYETAAEYNFKVLRYGELKGHKRFIAAALHNLGTVRIKQNRLDEARDYFQQVVEYGKELDDPELEGMSLLNLGNIRMLELDFVAAIPLYEDARAVLERFNDASRLALCYTNMMGGYAQLGQLEKSLELGNMALEIYSRTNNREGLVTMSMNMGSLQAMRGNLAEAVVLCKRGIRKADRPEDRDVLADAYLTIAKIYEFRQDFDSALYYHKSYAILKDSLLDEASTREVSELQVAYGVEKKDRENAILQKDLEISELQAENRLWWAFGLGGALVLLSLSALLYVRQRKMAERRQAAELEHKALRAQMNPHFIFNALQGIQRVYQSGDLYTANDYLADFGKLMRKIMDNSSKTMVSLKEELETLEVYLNLERMRMEERLSYAIEAEEVDLLNTEIPSLLIQPLVENAIWHGIARKPDKTGKVVIRLSETEKGTRVEVIDDGVGLHSQAGAAKAGFGKGIQLLRDRLGGRGEINLEDRSDAEGKAGTRAIIDIYD